MSHARTKHEGLTRRSLARTLGGAAAAAMVPGAVATAEEPLLPSQQDTDARTDALVDAALASTPARLSPEQRLDVRRAVRDTQKTLRDLRKIALGPEVDPATVFLARP